MSALSTTQKAAMVLGLAVLLFLPAAPAAQAVSGSDGSAHKTRLLQKQKEKWAAVRENARKKKLALGQNQGMLAKTNQALAAITYTQLDYSKTVTVGGAPVTGKLSDVTLDPNDDEVTAAGLSFQAQEGKGYKITIKYQSNTNVDMDAGFSILTSGALTGNIYYDIIDWGSGGWGEDTKELTVTGYFISPETGMVRVLMGDYELNVLNYTITIEESNITLYTQLDYSKTVTVGGAPTTGKLSVVTVNPLGYVATAAGLSFQAEKGNSYKITVNYKANADVYMIVGYYVLTDGNLTGDFFDDVIDWDEDDNFDYDTNELTLTGEFTSPKTGLLRIMLSDEYYNELNYTVSIKSANSILSQERKTPTIPVTVKENENTAAASLINKLTAGPNPTARQSGAVTFFWQGKWIQSTTLTIFDASGNVVNKKAGIKDKAVGTQANRPVGSWNLTDMKGRPVAEGTYLAKGTVTTSDGKKERVSVMIGVR